MMIGHGYGMMFGFGWLGWIFQFLILIAVIYLISYGIRAFARNSRQPESSSTQAFRILDERFARGEISAEEYKTMKEHLKDK